MKAQKERILLCKPKVCGRELKYIEEALADDWIVPLGPNVNGFEADLRKFMGGSKEIVALSSGTAAIHLALISLGVGPGDEVMVQSFTFCASSHPVTYLGATPVFVDSESDTWNLDPVLLDRAIADRKEKTGRLPKAIIPVYLYGMPGKIDEIFAVADKWGIPVVEDAAEAFGSCYKGRRCGTFGRYGCLSFNGNKMVTSAGGGALITADKADWKDIMNLATQARDAYPYYQHTRIGYNYRMSNICAGVGRGQMEVVEEYMAHHKHVKELYKQLFTDTPEVIVHDNPTADYDANFWLVTITFPRGFHIPGDEDAYGRKVDGAVGGAAGVVVESEDIHTDCEPLPAIEYIRQRLDALNIETRPLWKPMHRQPVYAANPAYINGVAEDLFSRGLCLPSGPWVSDDDVRTVADAIKEIIKK